MSYYDFGPNDITHTSVVTNPSWSVILQGNAVTGSIYLEKKYLNSALANRQMQGFSERLGGLTTITATITASVDFLPAQFNGNNKQLYGSIQNLTSHYALINNAYNLTYNGSTQTLLKVISIPQVYYDNRVKSASFSASDLDTAGALRELFDNGTGGIYSGSLTGSLVGNIFYAEGLVVLKAPNLTNFGAASPGNFKWRTAFQGQHTIPVNIYRCRAPAGELNATTNPTFYTVPTSGPDRNYRMVLSSSVYPYITAVGFYNQDHELVAVARLAQPIKKDPAYDIAIQCKMDW